MVKRVKKCMQNGFFITFEGIDSSGKSLQSKALEKNLRRMGYPVTLVRDPGGPFVSEQIRNILLDRHLYSITPLTELFLYEAARSQLVSEIISPALEREEIVLADRFVDSTVAYQGYGRLLSDVLIENANRWACGNVYPNRTYILDISWEESIQRRAHSTAESDRMEREQKAFYQRVQEGYRLIAKTDPQRTLLLDGIKSFRSLEQEILTDALIMLKKVKVRQIKSEKIKGKKTND